MQSAQDGAWHTHIYLSVCIYVYMLLLFSCSVVSDSFATPRTVAHQAPLSMGFPSQEYWRAAISFSRDLPDPGVEHMSPASQIQIKILCNNILKSNTHSCVYYQVYTTQ